MNEKQNQNLLLGVTGSISAYKAYDLTREMKRRGLNVRVVLSRGAEEFVQWQTFLYLGAEAVYRSHQDFEYPKNRSLNETAESDLSNVLHIALARWTDQFVVAPLSANTLSRLATGQTDDLLSSIFLSLKSHVPKLFFPAMNTQMLEHPFCRENSEKLQTLSHTFIHPTCAGELACGEEGGGRLPSVEEMADLIEAFPAQNERKETILISTGATISPLDPVRYLTNPSSGKTGYEIAKRALREGFRVKVLAGMSAHSQLNNFRSLPQFEIKHVRTNDDMANAVMKRLPQADSFISAAAITDLKFPERTGKLKKDELHGELQYEKDTDILYEAVKEKKPGQFFIGFAAETNLTENMLKAKQEKKPVDLLVGTRVGFAPEKKQDDVSGFQKDYADYALMEGEKVDWKTFSKKELAQFLVDKLKNVF